MKLNIKITLIVILIFLAIMSISSIINILIYRANYSNTLLAASESVGNNLLSVVDELLSLGLQLNNLEGMDEKCKWMVEKNAATVAYCFIADPDGKILYHNDDTQIGKTITDSAMTAAVKQTSVYHQLYIYENKMFNDTTIPVIDSAGAHIGLIRIGSPVAVIDKKIGESIIASIIIFVVSFFFFGIIIYFVSRSITNPLKNITDIASRIAAGETGLKASDTGRGEIAALGYAFNSMTDQLRDRMESFKKTSESLERVVATAKAIIMSLNSSSKEIEAAAQEQTSASNENASGITEVSATLQELTITAKQISTNVGELVFSSEETVKLLKASEKQLLDTVSQLDDVGAISRNNTTQINELGKRSVLINEMVELIKEVANKTNILSINASIEASRSGEAGAGFSVVAAEIRELSKETIESAKKADIAAKEIKDFLNSIIISSENESGKVTGSGKTVRSVFDNVGNIVTKIANNYGFTQKIDMSIKQQENGSIQAAETMRQMAEIARQSAETARQTLSAVKDIVVFSSELEKTVTSVKTADQV
jgi:methyl-accepting chemotaxis protein